VEHRTERRDQPLARLSGRFGSCATVAALRAVSRSAARSSSAQIAPCRGAEPPW
jgi:hypothetical protein